MSAALALDYLWATAAPLPRPTPVPQRAAIEVVAERNFTALPPTAGGLAFYRQHTQKTLRRYLYASMLVGRAPSILSEPVSRGWASSRPVRTFEDAVIFVLDVESCLGRLSALDRQILGKVVLQDYTQAETACLLGMSQRSMSFRFPQALDRLTRLLMDADLLVLPGR